MESIKLNLIPSGVNPTCHCSQYDNGRVIRVYLFDGISPYALQSGDTVTLNVRKPDNTIVTASVTATQGNTYVDIVTTEQICAVVGYNLCDLTITNGETVIGTLNFIMAVERDVLADGIPSQSVIEDLDALVQEAVGDQYYTKSETDTLLDNKADKSTTYTKTEVNTALSTKANVSELQSLFDTVFNPISYLTGKYYHLSTGNLVSGSSYTGTEKYFGNNVFAMVDFDVANLTDVICFWNNDEYVGYFFRNKYYNPSSVEVTSLTYNLFALDVSPSSTHGAYKLYNLVDTNNQIANIKDLTQPLVNSFDWTQGSFYNLTSGNPSANSMYWRTNIVNGSEFAFNDNSLFFNHVNNYISFWSNGVYAGYYLGGKYYNPSRTEVASLTYDQWAANYYANSSDTTHNNIKPNSIDARLDKLENTPSRFAFLGSKSIGFLGDSITYGIGASDRLTTSYVALMQNEFGSVTNYGVSGTLIAEEEGYSNAMVDRYVNMSDNLDIVVVYGGTNDWYYGTQWGTTDSTDKTTFLGALNVLMSGLVEKYCGKEIFFVTPMSSAYSNKNTDNQNACGKTMLDYRNAIIERATYHAIPVIDLYSMCNMDVAHNAANKTYYSSDGVHPNDAGYKRVHDRILTFIANILC